MEKAIEERIMSTLKSTQKHVFNGVGADEASVVALSETKALIVYTGGYIGDGARLLAPGPGGYCAAVIATVSGDTISYSAPHVFDSSTGHITVTALSETKALMVYADGNKKNGAAVIVTVSGDNVKFSSKHAFTTEETNNLTAIAITLSETKVLIAYSEPYSYQGNAVIATVSGDNVTFSPKHVFTTKRGAYRLTATALSETTALIAYRDYGYSSQGVAVIVTVSGETISCSPEHVFNAANTQYISATALSPTTALIVYNDFSNSHHGTAVLATISGEAILFSPEYVFNTVGAYSLAATALSKTQVMIAYAAGGGEYSTTVIATVSGDGISYSPERVSSKVRTTNISATALSGTKALIAFRAERKDSNYGAAIIATIADEE